MNLIKYIFVRITAIFVALSLLSCWGMDNNYPKPYAYKSYAASFVKISDMSISVKSDNDICVELFFDLNTAIGGGNDRFENYIDEYGDTGYCGIWDNKDHFRTYPRFSIDYPVLIEIRSDKDWDMEHPAGSLLNDLFDYYALSAYPFVKAGYEPYVPSGDDDVIYDPIWQYYYEDRYYDMSGSGGYDEKFDEIKEYYGYEYNPLERYPVVKPFGDVEESDYYMLGTGISDGAMFILRPRTGPEIEKWHNIKVRVAVTGVQFVNQGDFVLDFRDEAEKSGNQAAARHGR